MKKWLIFLLLFAAANSFAALNSWNQKTNLPGSKRERACGFSIGTKGYLVTGQDTGDYMLADCWQYNSNNDTWTQKANFPGVPRRDAFAMTIGTKGYVGGGIDNAVSSLGNILSDFYEYDQSANTWTQKADYANGTVGGVYFSTAFGIGTKGYVCGGKKGTSLYTADLWSFDTGTNTWTQKAPLPTGVRYSLSSFIIGNFGYVGLGADNDIYRNDFWKYDPGADSWQQIASFPATARGAATTFTINTRGYVVLGSYGGYQDDLFEYEVQNNTWTPRALYVGGPRRSAVGFECNGLGYVGTGKGYSGLEKDWWEYSPAAPLSVNELKHLFSITVFPNPVKEEVHIYISTDVNSNACTYQLTDVNGKLISEDKFNGNSFLLKRDAEWKAGIYFITVVSGKEYSGTTKLLFE